VSLPTSFLATQATALAAVVGLAIVARTYHHLSAWYPLTASGALTVMALVAMSGLSGYHGFARFGPANQVTTARAAIVALLVGLMFEAPRRDAAVIAAAAAFLATTLDGLDGWLARRSRMESAFGARFDVEVDALLIQALAILVWQHDKAGPWVILSGLLRYLFVAAAWPWPWMGRALPGTFRAKAICVIQILVLIAVLLPFIDRPWSAALAMFGLIALACSFAVDTLSLWRQERRERMSRTA
jgi:phosphatidylglycerophosphate synthase